MREVNTMRKNVDNPAYAWDTTNAEECEDISLCEGSTLFGVKDLPPLAREHRQQKTSREGRRKYLNSRIFLTRGNCFEGKNHEFRSIKNLCRIYPCSRNERWSEFSGLFYTRGEPFTSRLDSSATWLVNSVSYSHPATLLPSRNRSPYSFVLVD